MTHLIFVIEIVNKLCESPRKYFNFTLRNATECPNPEINILNFTENIPIGSVTELYNVTEVPTLPENEDIWWHHVFWISPHFAGIYKHYTHSNLNIQSDIVYKIILYTGAVTV